MTASTSRAALLTLVAALLWGVWWMPIRGLAGLGLSDAWAGAAMAAGGFVFLTALTLMRGRMGHVPRRAIVGAAFIGLAAASYSVALVWGEVVRAVLLFYLAPVWGKLIERFFMGRPWSNVSTVAIVLSFAGLGVLLGGAPVSGAAGIGDALAVLSGMSWAIGSALVFSSSASDTLRLSAWTAGALLLISGGFALFFAPPPEAGAAEFAIGIGSGAIYIAPILFMTLWSARRLAPAALSFILTAEIISGVVSSAVFLDEPFGLAHVLGTVLIIAGALTEVVWASGGDHGHESATGEDQET